MPRLKLRMWRVHTEWPPPQVQQMCQLWIPELLFPFAFLPFPVDFTCRQVGLHTMLHSDTSRRCWERLCQSGTSLAVDSHVSYLTRAVKAIVYTLQEQVLPHQGKPQATALLRSAVSPSARSQIASAGV